MRTEIGGLAVRITTLEQRVAIADAIRERDEREAREAAPPAKR
jgi:DNA-binding FadR family transcriptional regulator